MAKRYHNLSLAKSPEDWHNLSQVILDAVTKICGAYDDPDQVRAFLTIFDLATNRAYSQGDRDSVVFEANRAAFTFAPEFQSAQDQYMAKLMPYQETAIKTA